MSWENILKRPFNVEEEREAELQNREQKKQKALDLFPRMFDKYFDPEFKKLIRRDPDAKIYRVSMSDEISDYVKTLMQNNVRVTEIGDMIKNAYPGVQQVTFDGHKIVFNMS